MLHLSFIFIIVGAAITRYISYEGMMPICEGATESKVYSDKTFLTIFVDGEYKGAMKRRILKTRCCFHQLPTMTFLLMMNSPIFRLKSATKTI